MKKYFHEVDTIIAQCTPQGAGALALLRMSGSDAVTIATQISKLSSGKKLSDLPTHTIHFGSVTNQHGTPIDHVLFLLMRGPKTFTGEDTVEITTHNNQFIISAIIERALACGARLAQEGEFSKRAFLHGKIDLNQAEAINELIHAQTQQSLKASLAQLEGSLSHTLKTFEKDLLHALSLSEASFEFIEDEEIEFADQIKKIIDQTTTEIKKLKQSFGQQKQIREGIRIALLGSVNAGKSSLFNLLLDEQRSIVTNIAGTTRDVVEAGQYTDGAYLTFVDTAGLRETENKIEQEGIKRSLQQAHKADIILLVIDSSREQTQEEKNIYQDIVNQFADKLLVIHNKSDLSNSQNVFENTISISCKTKKNIEAVTKKISEKIKKLFSECASPFLLNQRQYSKLLPIENHLKNVLLHLEGEAQYELVSVHLKKSLEQLSELSGKTINQQAVDKIFSHFCVGK